MIDPHEDPLSSVCLSLLDYQLMHEASYQLYESIWVGGQSCISDELTVKDIELALS